MVQYYPDNQDRLLFRRKEQEEAESALHPIARIVNPRKGDKYEEIIKEKLQVRRILPL